MKTQRQKVLDLLKESGNQGVNSYDLTYIHSIKQAPTRIKELRESGYVITSTTLSNRSVQYRLDSIPLKDRPFKWDFSQGFARKLYE